MQLPPAPSNEGVKQDAELPNVCTEPRRDVSDMHHKALWSLTKRANKGFRGYPIGTVAFYGPNDRRASKVAVGVVPREGAEATELERWFSDEGDVEMTRTSPPRSRHSSNGTMSRVWSSQIESSAALMRRKSTIHVARNVPRVRSGQVAIAGQARCWIDAWLRPHARMMKEIT